MIKKIVWPLAHFIASHFKRKVNEEKNLPRKILVMRYGFLGDVLQTTPVLKALHKKWPEAKIDYWVSNAAAPALKNNPNVNKILDADRFGQITIKKPLSFLRNGLYLRKRKYDLAVCLGSDPMYGLLAWLGGVNFRVGLITDKKKSAFLTKSVEVRMNDKGNSQQKCMELLSFLGIKLSDEENKIELFYSKDDDDKIFNLLGDIKHPLVAFFPGGGENKYRPWANRKWPQEKWIELGQQLLNKYREYRILFFGTEKEAPTIELIVEKIHSDRLLNVVGKTTFTQLGPLLKRCKLLVTNDSSPVFVAAAVNCPTVVLYGPEWPERTRPIFTKKWYPIFVDVDCRNYCASFPQKPPECKNECLSSITVEMVLEKIDAVLHNG